MFCYWEKRVEEIIKNLRYIFIKNILVGGLIDQPEEFTTEAKKSAAMLGEELACLLDEYRHLHFALFTMKTYTYC